METFFQQNTLASFKRMIPAIAQVGSFFVNFNIETLTGDWRGWGYSSSLVEKQVNLVVVECLTNFYRTLNRNAKKVETTPHPSTVDVDQKVMCGWLQWQNLFCQILMELDSEQQTIACMYRYIESLSSILIIFFFTAKGDEMDFSLRCPSFYNLFHRCPGYQPHRTQFHQWSHLEGTKARPGKGEDQRCHAKTFRKN